MTTDWERKHYAKQQLNGNMRDSLCPDTKCLLALIQSLKNRAIYSQTCMCTACCEYLICVHILNRGFKSKTIQEQCDTKICVCNS